MYRRSSGGASCTTLYRVQSCERDTQQRLGGRLPASPESVALFRLTCLLLLRCLLCRLLGRLLGCLLRCHGVYSPLCCNAVVAVTECIEWANWSVKKKMGFLRASLACEFANGCLLQLVWEAREEMCAEVKDEATECVMPRVREDAGPQTATQMREDAEQR